MSDKICFTSPQTKADLDKLGSILLQHYNKNIETTLNEDDESLLNNVTKQLEELSKNSNVEFNSEGFKSFIKKLYIYDLTQYGGDPPDEIVPYSSGQENSYSGRSSISMTIAADFMALLGFFTSLFLFYLVYENLTAITQGVTGYTPVGVGEEVMEQFEIAREEVRKLDTSQLSYLHFFYQIFSTFGCSVVETNIANIQQIFLIGLQNSFRGISARVTSACLTSSQEVSSRSTIGMLSSLFNIASAPTASLMCVNERTKIETSLIQAQVNALQDSLFLEISTRAQQISGNITLSLQIGIPCATYLMARIVYVTTPIITKISNSMKTSRNENGREMRPFRITETGGRKKHTKKNNKKKKTYRKNKKTSRKHRNKSRKY
jgi:hypothetical protein